MITSRLAAFAVMAFCVFIFVPHGARAGEQQVTGALIYKLLEKGVLDEGDYQDIMRPAPPDDTQALNRRLIRKLYENGVLDEASFIELSGMAGMSFDGVMADAGTGGPHAEPQSSPAKSGEPEAREAVKPIAEGLAAIEQGVARAGRDNVSLKINFFFQGGFVYDSAGTSVGTPPTSGFSGNASSQFFVRRARLYLSGNVLEKIGYKVSFETASSTILRDAFAYLDYIPYARLTVGQFKVPFGYEGPLALAKLPVANRSLATNFIHAPTLRDVGVMLSGGFDTELAGLPLGGQYWAGVFNGTGMNSADSDDHKDIAVRTRLKPLLPGLAVGGSWYWGSRLATYKVSKQVYTKWERLAGELLYMPTFAKGLTLQAEYLWQRRNFPAYPSHGDTGLAKSKGWYVLAAYRLNGFDGAWDFMNGFEPAARYEFFDEDTKVRNNERYRTTLGLNYYLAKDTRLMLNYELIKAGWWLNNVRSLQAIDKEDHELLTTLMQVKF